MKQLVFHGMPLTLPKTNHPKKEIRIPTIHFQEKYVSFREGQCFVAAALPGWFPLREEPHQAAGVTMAPTYAPSSALASGDFRQPTRERIGVFIAIP